MTSWVSKTEWDFVLKNDLWSAETERTLFAAGAEAYEVEYISESEDMLDILVRAGSFTSRSQARKNGWDDKLPAGFSQIKIGMRILTIWIPV